MFTNVSRPSAVDVLRPFAVGDTFYADTTSTLAKLAAGSAGSVYSIAGGIPTWTFNYSVTDLSAATSAGITIKNASGTNVALLGAGPGTGTTFYGGVVLDAETANRIVTTGASKDLDTPAAISTAQTLTLSAGSGTSLDIDSTDNATSAVTGSVILAGGIGVGGDYYGAGALTTTGKNRSAYFVTTVGQNSLPSGDDSVAMVFMTGASGSAPFNSEGSLVYRSRVSATAGRSSHYWYTGSPATQRMRLDETGILTLSNTTDSTSKDTGSIVTEGGIGAEKQITAGTGFRTGSTTLMTSSVALTNGAGASAGTLTNAPSVGNPTKWVPINDNGTTRYIPCW